MAAAPAAAAPAAAPAAEDLERLQAAVRAAPGDFSTWTALLAAAEATVRVDARPPCALGAGGGIGACVVYVCVYVYVYAMR